MSVVAASLAALLFGALLQMAEPLPIFDAHIHYSSDAWSLYDEEQARAILDRANIRVALVSSTFDDGTLKLHARCTLARPGLIS